MKLFQRLLVAPAALGLMAPLAATADVAPVSNESDLSSEVIQARVDGIEAQLGEIQAGAFSSTTTLSGKAAFITGYVEDDQNPTKDETTLTYMYQLNLNSSFTGDDLLYTRLKAGNTADVFNDKTSGAYLSATKNNDDGAGNQNIAVDKIWYQFPVGDNLQVWVGPKIENYYMLASAPSIYKPVTKQFALGGNASTYGSSTSPGFGVAWTQSVDDPSDGRFALSMNYTGKGGASSTDGLLDEDSKEFFLTKVEYGTPKWQVSAALANKTNGDGYDSYYHTTAGQHYDTDITSIGLRAYWKPDETGSIPEVQIGYDTVSVDNAAVGMPDEMNAWMVGLGWKDLFIDGNRAGVAFGSRQAATSFNGTPLAVNSEAAEDNFVWEAYYTFKVNDGVSVTPAVFGGSDVDTDAAGASVGDVNGAVLLTEFRF